MKYIQYIQDKRKQRAIRALRNTQTAQKGATTWNEQQRRTSDTTSFFSSSLWNWIKKDGWALAGICIIIFGFGGYYLFFSQNMRVDEVLISDTLFLDKSAVQKEVDTHLQSKFLGLVPRNAYFLLSEDAIAKKIQSSFGQNYALAGVQVTKTYPNTVSIQITERIPSVVWITKGNSEQEKVYTVDQNGIVTQQLGSRKDANPGYPVIIDQNREELGIGWHIISAEYIAFAISLRNTFTDTTGAALQEFVLPKIACHKQEYVAEEVFKKAENTKDSADIKKQKREIQERFQRGEITIDESIALLEQVNASTEENAMQNVNEQKKVERIEWETVQKPTECDIVTVAQDIYIKTKAPKSDTSFFVYFDTTANLDVQLKHVVTILHRIEKENRAVQYIDVRLPDRVYFQ